MAKKSMPENARAGSGTPVPAGERELVFIASTEADLRATTEGLASMAEADTDELNALLSDAAVTARPLFGVTEERLRLEAATTASTAEGEVPDLSKFYRVDAPDDQLDTICEKLQKLDVVEAAYVKPAVEPPMEPVIEDITALTEDAPPVTQDFSPRQLYLNSAPGGVNARWAWTRPGGGGRNVRVIDIEGAWRFSHEDLTQNQGGVVGGTQSTDIRWRNHGTAVIGVIGGDVNSFGITGISPDAIVSAISIFGGMGSAGAIRAAANRLQRGDIILIELHRPGPRHNFSARNDQLGYIAIEWWEDDFAAIRYATSRGVIVIEAAGNGAENLDDPLYNTPGTGFPAGWTNPFNRSNRDSGAIIVGAGAPPRGTHGRSHGADRSRLGFSNYGALVDAQGWGREVTTTGYGYLQGGTNEDFWYTDTFSGTSSASPVVVGSVACVQGLLRSSGRQPMTPTKARQCLRSTGSPQQDTPGRPRTQRIGNRPDIPALYQCARTVKIKETKEVKELKEPKELKERIKDRVKERLKDRKELRKEIEKDLRKELKDRKEIYEGKLRDVGRVGHPAAEGDLTAELEDRIASLEGTVEELVHFITQGLRPDLGEGALTYEEDDPGLDATGARLEKESADAKVNKDYKDTEKLGESGI